MSGGAPGGTWRDAWARRPRRSSPRSTPSSGTPRWPFPSDDERRRWFYTPTDHGGLTLGGPDPTQQRSGPAAGRHRARPAPATSPSSTIIGLENVLDEARGLDRQFPGPERGRDPARYYLRVFGDPASGHVVVALRRPPRLDPPHRRRRRGPRVHAVLLRRPTRRRRRCSARIRCGRWPAPRTWPASWSGRSTTASGRGPPRPVAPTDIVGGNRSRLDDGDVPLPCWPIWRGTPAGPSWLGWRPRNARRGGDRATAGRPRGLRLTLARALPRAFPHARPRRGSRSCCGRCSPSTWAGSPTSWRRPRRPSTSATGCTPCSSHGRRLAPANPTTTGCRDLGFWSSTTTPSATPTTCTPSGAIRTVTSAPTCSPSTTPRTYRGRHGHSALDRRRPAPDLQELVHQLARPAWWHDLGLTVPLAHDGDVGAGAVNGDRGPAPAAGEDGGAAQDRSEEPPTPRRRGRRPRSPRPGAG